MMLAIDRQQMDEEIQAAVRASTFKPEPKTKSKTTPKFVMPVVDFVSTYELTLTTPDDDPKPLWEYIDRVCKLKSFGVVHIVAALELTKAAKPHIHALLYTNKRFLDAKKVKYPHRFELKKVQSLDRYYEYIMKDVKDPRTIEYCNLRQVDHLINKKIE